ncbi:hypothetical protein DYI37_12220 [Fulvimarina endophytica]|uniref:Uncharacterized protein n=1 Tax=Fulvimarina endophytica TaxID=2293836 RepID=A0A371X0L2_9HYPH|nr:hypothetical protein [Fulvimarina endophytica]RFC62735.1 hypothetical protein DYI37_12220 [Fulvimarina endophytica]
MVQPDLRALRDDGTEHILVLDNDQNPPFPPNENRDESSALRILRRSDVEGDRLENARELLRYARWRVPLSERIRLLAALDAEGSLSLAECLSLGRPGFDAIAMVAALALHRFVVIDLDSGRIGPETRVTLYRG